MTLEDLSYFTERASWACVECGSDQLTAKQDGGEAIPDSAHFVTEFFTCPALMPGSTAMVQCWADIWDALEAAGYPLAVAGETVMPTGEPTASGRWIV